MESNRGPNVWVILAKVRTEKRVAIYCRVSTTKDSQEGSLAAEKYGLQQIVKNNPNWTLYRVYEDQDSGKDTFRPGFQSMM